MKALWVLEALLRRTLTCNRGSEMARHAEVTAGFGKLQYFYFCDPERKCH